MAHIRFLVMRRRAFLEFQRDNCFSQGSKQRVNMTDMLLNGCGVYEIVQVDQACLPFLRSKDNIQRSLESIGCIHEPKMHTLELL